MAGEDILTGSSGVMQAVRAGPMSPRQYIIVAVCLLINLLDGFDVLAMTFTAPTVAATWHLSGVAVGGLLSAGPAGMGVGAFLLSPLGDRFGRKLSTVCALALVAAGMFAASTQQTYDGLLLWRFVTGLGIGAMISSISALLVEFVSSKARGFAIGLMATTFPAGATAGAAVSLLLIEDFGWRIVFTTGAVATLVMAVIALLLLSESVDFLLARANPASLPLVNKILASLRAEGLQAMPASKDEAGRRSASALAWATPAFREALARIGVVMFLTMLSFYFILSWAPKLQVQRGLSIQAGVAAGLWMNLGGIAGGFLTGVLLRWVGVRTAAGVVLVLLGVGVAAYGLAAGSPAIVPVISGSVGFLMYGAMAVVYVLMATAFSPEARVTGIGVSSAAGRVGAMAGPYLGGLLLDMRFSIPAICTLLAAPAVLAAGAALIRRRG